MADTDIVQVIAEARIDARSLSEFVFKPADFMVRRRLAPPINTLEYYLNLFNKTATDGAAMMNHVIINSGFVTIDSFELGATLTQRNQALRHAADGKLYRWAGNLPKVVPASSTPANSGGIGENAWLEVSDTTLRQDLLGLGGAAKIPFNAIVFNTLSELSAAQWLREGLTVQTLGYYKEGDGGGNTYLIEPSGTAITHSHIVTDNGFVAKGLFPSGDVHVKQLGAKGDGVTDDYPAIFKAINLFPSQHTYTVVFDAVKYKINTGLFITRALNLVSSGGKESGKATLDAKDAVVQTVSGLGGGGGIFIPHSSIVTHPSGVTLPTGQVGNYGAGATIRGIQVFNSPTNGIMVNAPATLEKCAGSLCSGNGIVIAGGGGLGNANHTDIIGCLAHLNGKSGIYTLGSDANTFNISGCVVNKNTEYGINDHSLLGGTVSACEADGNGIADYNARGGYLDNSGLASGVSNTTWISNYSEGDGTKGYSLPNRHLVIGATGGRPRTNASSIISGITGVVSTKTLTVADSESAAFDKNKGFGSVGKGFFSLGHENHTGDNFQISYSGGYIEFKAGSVILMRLKVDVDFNASIKRGRPYFVGGFALGAGHNQTVGSMPTTGAWTRGSIVWNETPVADGSIGWVCVSSGSPGVWKSFGKIEA